MMKAIRIQSYGGPDVMRLEELPLPAPGPHHIRVRVMAAGVNFSDVLTRRAYHSILSTELPATPGLEGAGIVEAIGEEVTTRHVGERVAWSFARGSYATHVLVPAQDVFPLPDAVTFEQAAAVLVQGSMAHLLSHAVTSLSPTDRCLIHTIAGGVGLLLCQMAKARGAQVIGTTSTASKARVAFEAGADHVIVYTQTDFEAEVKRITHGEGVTVLYDTVGKDAFERNLNCLAVRGLLVSYGTASGPIPPVDMMAVGEKGSLFLTRVVARDYMGQEEQQSRVHDLFTRVVQGTLRPLIGETYALADAAKAHEALEKGQTVGKVLLVP